MITEGLATVVLLREGHGEKALTVQGQEPRISLGMLVSGEDLVYRLR